MWISDFSIRKPVVTTVVMIGLVLFGATSLVLLDTDEYPAVQPPVVAVSLPYPGASAANVERGVVDVLEDAFTSISGVKHVRSSAQDSLAVMVVEFQFSKDLQQATQDIRDRISEVRDQLPPEMKEPVLRRFDPNDLPIVSLTLSSPERSRAELTRLADPGLSSALRGVAGVANVSVVGGLERELRVDLHPEALRAAGIGVAQVVQALAVQNLAAPVGRLLGTREEEPIRLRGRLAAPSDFEKLVVARSGRSLARLGDVATVSDGTAEPRSGAMFDGKPAVGIDIVKATGASTTTVSARIRERVRALRETLPSDTTLRVVRDAGTRVRHSVQDVELSLLLGALLTVVVVFFFLNSWRSTVITGIALPVSALASFIFVHALGFTLNTMSLLGLSLAIGILIDDAIVVRENIVRHMQGGADHVRAAREGTAEIGLAVAATTVSIVVVFVPIGFMGGVAQQWFAPFALTIASSVLVSLLVSFSLDPMLSSVWADPALEHGVRGKFTSAIARLNAWLAARTVDYQRVVAWALDHRLLMMALAIGTFVVALALPALGVVGSEFFPREDRSEFTLELRAPPGSSLAYTTAKAQAVSRIARQLPEVQYTYTTLGGQTQQAVDEASMYVRLSPKSARSLSQQQISARLRRRISHIAGITASLSTSSFGPQKQIQLQITGPSLNVLDDVAKQVAQRTRSVPGAVDVALSSKGRVPELEVELHRDVASALDVSVAQVAQALRPAFAGVDAGDWVDPSGETRDVTVRFAPAARDRLADLEGLPLILHDAQGRVVTLPLEQIASVTRGVAPALISHLDGQRVITVGANTERRPLNEVVAGIRAQLAQLHLPQGVTITQGGETESQREVFTRIVIALGVAIVLMYLILVIQFDSFLDPIPIMASLPLSLVGVVLGLWLTGSTLNLMSLIGVILLMGIVAKNAILLIDFAKWSERRGTDRKSAIIEAGGVRLRPIVMTSLAIVAGMLPVAIGWGEGADFRAPLGRAVIGGVITSTLLTLVVIPTFYDMLASLRDGLARRWFSRPTDRVHANE
jgi:hydrophobe/amphiphile efflux-1 (HAE1) family protein